MDEFTLATLGFGTAPIAIGADLGVLLTKAAPLKAVQDYCEDDILLPRKILNTRNIKNT